MDCFLRTPKRNVSIRVIVCRFTKIDYFITKLEKMSVIWLVNSYVNEIVILHVAPVIIMSNCDPLITSIFWKRLHKALQMEQTLSSYHP